MLKKVVGSAAMVAALALTTAAHAFTPSKPVEFVVTAGAGGGTDIFARTIQSIIQKHNLMPQPIVISIKGGGSGAEGFVYGKSGAGDAHRIVFGTSNQWMLPLVSKVGWTRTDLTPVAAMAFDEFILWTKPNAPWKTAAEFVEAAKKGGLKIGGAQAKDLDQTLVRIMEKAAGFKTTYIPFKSGGEAAVQLAGGHIDANTNNPAENVGQWKAGQASALCVFSPVRLAKGDKVTATQSWSDIPTCKESGIAVDAYTMPRAIFLPGGVPAEAVAYWRGVLQKAFDTPEWKEYITRTSQSSRFLTGDEFAKFIDADEVRNRKIYEEEGWLVK